LLSRAAVLIKMHNVYGKTKFSFQRGTRQKSLKTNNRTKVYFLYRLVL